MMHKEIDVNKPLTDAQIAMLQALEARPDEPDTDCPELTEAQLSQFQMPLIYTSVFAVPRSIPISCLKMPSPIMISSPLCTAPIRAYIFYSVCV